MDHPGLCLLNMQQLAQLDQGFGLLVVAGVRDGPLNHFQLQKQNEEINLMFDKSVIVDEVACYRTTSRTKSFKKISVMSSNICLVVLGT